MEEKARLLLEAKGREEAETALSVSTAAGALIPFEFDGKPVRTLLVDGKPHFVGSVSSRAKPDDVR